MHRAAAAKSPYRPTTSSIKKATTGFRNYQGDVYRYPESELDLDELTPECLKERIVHSNQVLLSAVGDR